MSETSCTLRNAEPENEAKPNEHERSAVGRERTLVAAAAAPQHSFLDEIIMPHSTGKRRHRLFEEILPPRKEPTNPLEVLQLTHQGLGIAAYFTRSEELLAEHIILPDIFLLSPIGPADDTTIDELFPKEVTWQQPETVKREYLHFIEEIVAEKKLERLLTRIWRVISLP